jgi:YHS domain-containing protein
MFALLDRLFLLFVVISALRSAILFLYRLWAGTQARSAARAGTPGPKQGASAAGTTLLHQDPVCGTYVATDTSLKKIIGGKVIHFCSAECRDRYLPTA